MYKNFVQVVCKCQNIDRAALWYMQASEAYDQSRAAKQPHRGRSRDVLFVDLLKMRIHIKNAFCSHQKIGKSKKQKIICLKWETSQVNTRLN